MEQTAGKWIVKSFQSGTTWLKKLNDEGLETTEGFHIGYFVADPAFLTEEQLRTSRLDIARDSLLSCVCEGLNAIQEKPRPYVAGQFPSLLEVGVENKLYFTDSYYGIIDFRYFKVESEKWVPVYMPDTIVKEFRDLMDAFDQWDSGWND